MATSKLWQLARDAAERYERILVPAILGPAARSLVEWVDMRDGERVADIGCGTGAATRLAAEKVGSSGRVAGVDVNAGMIDVAQSVAPVRGAAIEWFENSAYQHASRNGNQVIPAAKVRGINRLRVRNACRNLSLWCRHDQAAVSA